MRDRLIDLLKQADKSAAERIITDYGVAIADNADYLLANGVIVLPVKVGDTVYKPIITDNTKKPAIRTIVVSHINVDINNHGVSPHSFVVGRLKNTHCGASFYFDEIGKTVFLTKEEAEQALAKMKGGE